MFYHDWALLRALLIFVIACSFLLVATLLELCFELRSRRRRDAGHGANLCEGSVQRLMTSAPAAAHPHPAREPQPTVAGKRTRAPQPVAA